MNLNIRNEIKSIIVREGMTLADLLDRMQRDYGWSSNVSNFTGKLTRGSLRYVQHLEVVDDVRFDAFQPRLGLFQVFGLNAEGDVLALLQTVGALGELVTEHPGVLLPNGVVVVVPGGQVNHPLVFGEIDVLIVEGELHMNGAVEVVQKVAPVVKDGSFVLVLRQLVVDVEEADGLGVVAVLGQTDSAAEHLLIRDGLLGAAGHVVPVAPLFQSQRLLLFARHGLGVTDRSVRFLHAFWPPLFEVLSDSVFRCELKKTLAIV